MTEVHWGTPPPEGPRTTKFRLKRDFCGQRGLDIGAEESVQRFQEHRLHLLEAGVQADGLSEGPRHHRENLLPEP